ncbi:MAG: M20/M25/M40 family metallo-hydrolase [Eubacteriales bacterium]|nr:M20/M25/M40 family metallo-hydrolase [Eubacteriales bacterium]MDD4476531.1 M20/M25/M40 family metallo-hydrolase [Eubacteriales bacterium]
MAGCDSIYVKFEGVSGHGSVPHLAKDTIHPACIFVFDLQGIVTKNINSQKPIVLSVGRFDGGTKVNVVAKYTQVEITMRYFDSEIREIAHNAIRRHAKAIADAYQIKIDVSIEEDAPSLYNDEELAILADKSAAKVFGEGKNLSLPKYMGSEDMPYYFKHAKGVYAFIGYKNREREAIYFPHHEKFKIDEDYMKCGAAMHVQFALDFLNE